MNIALAEIKMTHLLAFRLRISLKDSKLTQSELAQALRISKNTVSRWIQGHNFPTNIHLEAMRNMFGWSKHEVSELTENWYGNRSHALRYRIAGPAYVRRAYDGDYLRFLEDIIELDCQSLPHLEPSWVGNAQSWALIFEACPFTWRLLLRDGSICGYWHFLCLKIPVFDLIQSGEMADRDINLSMIDIPVTPGQYHVYFSMFALSVENRNSAALSYLMRSLSQTVQDFSYNGISFERILAVAETPNGEKLCEHFGLHQVGVSGNTGKVFTYDQDCSKGWGKLLQYNSKSPL